MAVTLITGVLPGRFWSGSSASVSQLPVQVCLVV